MLSVFLPQIGEGKAHVEKGENTFLFHRSVQKDRDPMPFVHMIGGKKTVLCAQRAVHVGIAFDVQNIDNIIIGGMDCSIDAAGVVVISDKAEPVSWNVHDNAVPFAVAGMAEDGAVRRIFPQIFRLCAIFGKSIV